MNQVQVQTWPDPGPTLVDQSSEVQVQVRLMAGPDLEGQGQIQKKCPGPDPLDSLVRVSWQGQMVPDIGNNLLLRQSSI